MIGDQTPEEESAGTLMDTEQETVQVSAPMTPMSMAATANVVGELPAEPTVREQATEIMLLLETVMRSMCEWSERIEAQTSAMAERDVIISKRRLENCETSLKRKNTAMSEAEKGQVELRKALEAKDAELAKVRAELEVERRTRTNATQLREELPEAQADVKSLRRRNGVLKGDLDAARQNEERMSDAFEMLNVEMKKSKEMWKRIQSRLVADVEQTTLDNGKLTQALEKRRAAMEKWAQEKDAAVRRHRQAQEELGPLWMELSVATKDLKKARANCDA
jgi:chromosome segregation ATPase